MVGTTASVRGCYALHPLSGMKGESFLCPFIIFLLLCRNKQDLCDPVICPRFKIGPGDFPRFLWEDEMMHAEDPTLGFLCHPILFAVSPLAYFPVRH